MANGQLSSSQLASIGGGLLLRKDAAAQFLAMSEEAYRRFGEHIQVRDGYRPLGHPGDLARGRWSQWAAWERYHQGGNLAAYPGTSNHGDGTAIDLARQKDRWMVDQIGAPYGFSKSWSDAPSEWWHIRFEPSRVTKHADLPRTPLRYRSRGRRVRALQRRLRAIGFRSVPVTGFFGLATRRSVKRFQRKHHLTADGVVGPSTTAALRRVLRHAN